MSSGPKQHPIQFLAVPVARAVLAAIVALSFFSTVVSLGTASSAAPGAMACCIGKPGHESGSCSTGLLEPAQKPQPEREVLCGQELAPPTAPSIKTIDVEAEAKDGDHCNLHAQSTGETTSATSEESESKAIVAATEESEPASIHTLSSPCPADCGTCSVGYTRRPRPREQSILSFAARPHLPAVGRLSQSDYPQTRARNGKWSQLRPRAPPASGA